MKIEDKNEFIKIITALSVVKPGKDLTPDALSIYFSALEDWTLEEFKVAAKHLAKTCEFMPNPYHFTQLRKQQGPTKHEAWEIALHRCKRPGEYPNDRVTKAARMVGGYSIIGMTTYDQQPFLAKRFQEAYESIGEVEEVPQLTKREASDVMRRLK